MIKYKFGFFNIKRGNTRRNTIFYCNYLVSWRLKTKSVEVGLRVNSVTCKLSEMRPRNTVLSHAVLPMVLDL